jgi:regulator of protease activity HflC (stomatin/prohibitin superfamily)
VELPTTMQRAMARQAEAERERRAKIIGAQGEYEAAEQLSKAADRISASPIALQLRYLQTLLEISSSNNATTILPIPIDILRPLSDVAKAIQQAPPAPPAPPAPADRP